MAAKFVTGLNPATPSSRWHARGQAPSERVEGQRRLGGFKVGSRIMAQISAFGESGMLAQPRRDSWLWRPRTQSALSAWQRGRDCAASCTRRQSCYKNRQTLQSERIEFQRTPSIYSHCMWCAQKRLRWTLAARGCLSCANLPKLAAV